MGPLPLVRRVGAVRFIPGRTRSAVVSDQKVRVVDEGLGSIWSNKYGLVLVDRLLAITKTGQAASKFDTGNGFVAQWQGSNGLNNQLWYLNQVFN